ncbi:MAG TPA: hypothetical protein VJM33_14005 [Microthrixaceae bacterium]|nr:hypothetical protein [Microthrixaceae bacterium]
MTDDFSELDPDPSDTPRIDAPTAEELTGEVQAVGAVPREPSRDRVREVRSRRHARRRRRRGLVTILVGVLLVVGGGLVWFALDDEPDGAPQVSGVSSTRPDTTTSTAPSTSRAPSTTEPEFIPVPEGL